MDKAASLGALLLSTASLTPTAVQAGFNAPYVGSYLYSGTLTECVTGAKASLSKHGYTVDEVVSFSDGKGSVVYARHNALALGASIECDPANGKGSWAVAGPNDKDAFESFKQLGNESW
jgi:hypothetical protein